MTKQQCIELFQALNAVGHLRGVKFSYGIAKNIFLLKTEIDALKKAIEPSSEFIAYDKLRVELAVKYAKKENDKPIIQNNEYIIEDRVAFDKAFENFKKEHKAVIDEREKQINEYKEFLKEDIKLTLFRVKLADIPKDISASELSGIISIIDE